MYNNKNKDGYSEGDNRACGPIIVSLRNKQISKRHTRTKIERKNTCTNKRSTEGQRKTQMEKENNRWNDKFHDKEMNNTTENKP